MSREPLATVELDGFLRLNRASLAEFQAALRLLASLPSIQCHSTDDSDLAVGALYVVSSDQGKVLCLSVDQALTITGWDSPVTLWLRVLAGRVRIGGRCAAPVVHTEACCVGPGALTVRLAAGTRLVMVIPSERSTLPEGQASRCVSSSMVRCLIDPFLLQARFFLDSEQAETRTRQLLARLVELETTGQVLGGQALPTLDRRVKRAIDWIRRESDWQFDLHSLASHAGASERNLYYLMKRETGVTPYRFYQHCRLIRVRRRLVDCQCEVPHISHYAADEGFSHLGRFAALYREHFGELPSETIQWRRALLDRAAGRQAS
ncbi:helix-turn-helix protein [Marinobacter pelagius]|uniref:Helix-turn-helix protein n=1 Tax=Marinobacter pelagius TaxID=379482 RepID=A0A366GXY8_9GAMM|nr:AraC family transcriptional regulator [Marinobacter pelagius]RBP33294.1 helix-turn-helix protein [Marinobacter pelagius]